MEFSWSFYVYKKQYLEEKKEIKKGIIRLERVRVREEMERVASVSRPLKIYFLPFFSPGHLIPLVQLARLVAARGQHVTIITTPANAQLFDQNIDKDTASGHHIRVHIIKFPNAHVGLPEGIEHLSAATNNETAYKIHMAAHLIMPQLESLVKHSPPDVFIPDILFTWTKDFSQKLSISRLVFNPISIFDVCMIHAIKTHPEAFASDSGPFLIPDLPHPLTLPVKPSPGFAALTESLLDGEQDSHGVIVNSFADLDAEYTQHYQKLTGYFFLIPNWKPFTAKRINLNNSTHL